MWADADKAGILLVQDYKRSYCGALQDFHGTSKNT
jgi:hypothetical protein